ncbi:MAG: uracil-DNA glycosylase family protein [Spirochaetes bacterium]|nr:uracil-DNA glycosylase family protein [Spirochaetota bacterium]
MLPVESLLAEIRSCTVCAPYLPLGPNPIIRAKGAARILLIGQAPGTKVHASGIPWNDQSGIKLRDWFAVDTAAFYNEEKFAIMPMGACYPGKGKSGDLPPRPECAPLWHAKVQALLPNLRLVILIGSYAVRYYLPQLGRLSVRDLVLQADFERAAVLPLVHPSPRNKLWLKQNPWFESGVIPKLRARLHAILRA